MLETPADKAQRAQRGQVAPGQIKYKTTHYAARRTQ